MDFIQQVQDSPIFGRALDFINPLGFGLSTYVALAVGKACAEELLNLIILGSLYLVGFPKLPSRDPKANAKGLESLEIKDYTFLLVNQGVELVFLFHLMNFGLSLPRDLEQLTVSNTVLVFYATFLVNDFFYYFMHRFLHVPAVYPFVHKHHHRQPLPHRGYTDAANESPIEQVGGLLCIWVTLKLLEPVLGFHALSLFAFFACFAVLAYLNHTPYDVKLGLWGLEYTVRAHETHHRMLRGNYSQNTMLWDKVFGTFIDYPVRKTE